MPSSAELARAYYDASPALRAAVAGLTEEQLTARPVAGKWSVLEVVAHLADFEPVFSDRILRVLALDNPTLAAADENLFVARLAPNDRNLGEELALIETNRVKMARLLSKLTPEQWRRTGTHTEKGPQTLEAIVGYATRHFAHHLPFIAEKRKAMGV